MRNGHRQAVEKELIGINTRATHFFNFADIDITSIKIGIKQRQPIHWPRSFFNRRGACDQHNFIRDLRSRYPDLFTRDNVVVTVPDSARFKPSGIVTRVRFCHAKAGNVITANDPWHPGLFLLFSAIDEQRFNPEQANPNRGHPAIRCAGF